MNGIELIRRERLRQVEELHWSPEHDDDHDKAELGLAARCYLAQGVKQIEGRARDIASPPIWPWAPSWWKPSPDPIRNLVKAGALIAAEIDRLQRVAL